MTERRTADREQWLADTLVQLADTLVADFDLLELLGLLVERCAVLLEATEAGLVLRDPHGGLAVMASSTERMRRLELFEVQSDEGPCLDCIRLAGTVVVDDLAVDGRRRWPTFAPRALGMGIQAALALPMRLRDEVIGAVNVLLDEPAVPPPADLRLAQALADAATISILQSRALAQSEELAGQLQRALDSRIVLEQAKGMLAELLDVDVDEAFDVMRSHARNRNLKLGDLAAAVVNREVDSQALVEASARWSRD
jgi:GAF domain-containing protein